MRILIFSLAYIPHVGGAEIAIKELTRRMPDADFTMIAQRFGDEPEEERVGNIQVYRVGMGSSALSKVLFIPRAVALARELEREQPFDLYWAMMSYMVFPVALLRLLGSRTPYVVTLQDGDSFSHVFYRLRILFLRPLLWYGMRHAAAVQVISNYLAAWPARLGYRGTPVVIPNGVDLTRFTQTRTHARSLDGLVLITTSRLVPKNAIDDIIRALVLLPESVRLRIYGTGREEEKLRALAGSLRVSDRVEFRGFVRHEHLPEALEEGGIFIRPSRTEGQGISFIEAMAKGLPVIATQVGGIKDFLFDARRDRGVAPTGWAVDVDAPDQIADAVKEIMTNPGETEATVENARRLVTSQYDWGSSAKALRELFIKASKAGRMAV